MSREDDEHHLLAEWLASRMDDAKLSAEERKEFTDWLMKDPAGQQKKKEEVQTGGGITLHEVRELFSWLKNRMTNTIIDEKERSQLNDWLVKRVSEHPTVGRDEFHKIRRDLLE